MPRAVVLQHTHKEAVGKFLITAVTHDFFLIGFLRCHEFNKYPVDFSKGRVFRTRRCILVASEEQEKEEQRFYHDIIGFKGDFLFARTLQEARIMVVANRGVMPVEAPDGDSYFGASMKRIPLTRGGEPIRRNYCAFWKRDNSGFYVEEFAQILKALF